jgi:short-subunit dehydrogenase
MFADFYKNKVVLITGGSMGIGKSLAWLVLQNGGKVVVTGRNSQRQAALEQEWATYNDRLSTVTIDVANPDGQLELMRHIQLRFGRLDVLFNNAALSAYGSLETTSTEVIHQLIDTNIKGILFTTRAALPLLQENKGQILFISSLAAFYGLADYSLYSLSKLALRALRQSLETELSSYEVNVAIAYVGFTENESDKRTLSPTGEVEAVPARPSSLTFSREQTALQLLQQLAQRKKVLIQGNFGKITFILANYFPFLLRWLMARQYRKKTTSIR